MNVELLLDTEEDRKRVYEFVSHLKEQSILIAYDELHIRLSGFLSFYTQLESIRILTSWSPTKGYPFYCYQRKHRK